MRFDKSDWQRLHKAIATTFWSDWDPIGVNEYPGTEDEYDPYVNGFVAHLHSGADVSRLTDYLWDCQRYNMGLESSSRELAERGAKAALRVFLDHENQNG